MQIYYWKNLPFQKHFLKIVKIFIELHTNIFIAYAYKLEIFSWRYLLAPPRRLLSLSNEKNM